MAEAREGFRAQGVALKAPISAILRADVGFALFMLAIIVALFMPLAPAVLDLFLAVSITFAVMILMMTLFISTPLDFSAFPSLLLVAAMLRLALNLASTRLILAGGHEGSASAGKVIEAFGAFVVGGDYVIGMIVFLILVTVNFVVITKGSGRIAEVAARFALDALPGKQIAIDADLASGAIDEKGARERREKLENESTFYGAMDGASKFVRGDAVAGLVITAINLIGGVLIGLARHGMPLREAGQTYALLTIGDGLVTQIPALVVSIAAGLLVSKAGVHGTANQAFMRQFSNHPKAIGLSAFVLIVLSFLPGMPWLAFWSLALIGGLITYQLMRWRAREQQQSDPHAQQDSPAHAASSSEAELRVEPLRIEVGSDLVSLVVEAEQDEDLTRQIAALRRRIAAERGLVLPKVRMVDNLALDPHTYAIKVREISAGQGKVYPHHIMAMSGGQTSGRVAGIEDKDPAFGVPVVWISPDQRQEAQEKGYTVVSPSVVMATHLSEVLRRHSAELLTYAQVKSLVERLEPEQRKLVDDLVPTRMSLSAIQRVLQALLSEGLSIRDLGAIIEAIEEADPANKNARAIAEVVRRRLARQICTGRLNGDGNLEGIVLSPTWESRFSEALSEVDGQSAITLSADKMQDFLRTLTKTLQTKGQGAEQLTFIVAAKLRAPFRVLIERVHPDLAVMSWDEVVRGTPIKVLAHV